MAAEQSATENKPQDQRARLAKSTSADGRYGASCGTGTTERAATTACVAKDDWPKKCDETCSSLERSADEPSARRPPKLYAPNSLQ